MSIALYFVGGSWDLSKKMDPSEWTTGLPHRIRVPKFYMEDALEPGGALNVGHEVYELAYARMGDIPRQDAFAVYRYARDE